jgi:hypothetical protein
MGGLGREGTREVGVGEAGRISNFEWQPEWDAGSSGCLPAAKGAAFGDEQVDRRPVFAALLSRRHRHHSGPLSLPDRAESSRLGESAASATKRQPVRCGRRMPCMS